jgi:mannose-6-phosphate isomerase class I
MSFMFNPYDYVDPQAVNHPHLPAALGAEVSVGTDKVARRLLEKTPVNGALFVDGYVGADFDTVVAALAAQDGKLTVFRVSDAYKSSDELAKMLAESLPEDRVIDPVLLFGRFIERGLDSLFDSGKVAALREKIGAARRTGRVVVAGCGALCAALRDLADEAAFVDVTPLRVTRRIQEGRVANLGDAEKRPKAAIFRRMYYYDYEIMMEHRRELIDRNLIDFYVDDNIDYKPVMLPLAVLKELFAVLVATPFRCTPVYLEGVWGGFFVKKLRHLPDDMRNCAWVFDMIPNEVSVQIKVGGTTVNIPFSTVFKATAEKLMGAESVRRFGDHFPIRFNYDDTLGGSGNMSIQVHPPQKYANENFGEPFQQDESYYVVKTNGSKTYLGLQDDCDPAEFFSMVKRAENEHVPFDHDKYVNSFPSEQGDQFLLPGGTIHASGRNQIVLEIGSYTIGSYTFKLYDYLRCDLEGNPRPIHSIHGQNVLVTERRRSKVDGVLRPRPVTVREGDGFKEEIVGEHELIYFSLRRLSFDRDISDDTKNEKFHVLTLVEGDEVLVYSKADPTRCYHQKFMDVVVVPASMGEYGIINLGNTPCKVNKTMLK